MKDTLARIQSIATLSPQTLRLEIATDNEALLTMKPGQSVLARIVDKAGELLGFEPYLREQWWAMGIRSKNMLRVEVPFHERYEPGQPVMLLGPIGKPFAFRANPRAVLLLAYDTPPTPLLTMVTPLLASRAAVTLVLLGSIRDYDLSHIPPEVEVLRGERDTMAWDGMVMTLANVDQVFAVVSPDDERLRFGELWRAIEQRKPDIPANYLWGVFQPILPCGVGACDACLLHLRGEKSQAVCLTGPAFDLKTLALR